MSALFTVDHCRTLLNTFSRRGAEYFHKRKVALGNTVQNESEALVSELSRQMHDVERSVILAEDVLETVQARAFVLSAQFETFSEPLFLVPETADGERVG